MLNNKLLNLSFYISVFIISFLIIYFPPANVLSYDVFGYYLYLPLSNNYHDLTLHNFSVIDNILNTYHSSDTFYQAYKLENGNWVMKYSMGMAVMYAPFYYAASVIAKVFNYPNDGFSTPYQLSVLYGCMLYTIVGLFYFKKILGHFFSDKIAAAVFLIIVFGTNYLFHVSIHGQGTMSHNVLFTLYAFVFWNTIKFHEEYKTKYAVCIGIGIGLMALIRPTEIIALLIPLLYGITSVTSLKNRILSVLKDQRLQYILMFLLVFFILSYQLLYLKILTGDFLFNTYDAINPGEGFEFSHPFIMEVLFSFRKGWFIYTPIMLLAFAGFYFLFKKNKALFGSILIYVLINLFIISSWSCWWYAASYSSRALIPSYVLMAIPLGYFLLKILSGKLKTVFSSVIVLLVFLNLFQSWQVRAGILDSTNMSRAYYKSIFLQTSSPTAEQKKLLLVNKFATIAESFTKEDSLEHQVSYTKTDNFENLEAKEDYTCDTLKFSGKRSVLTSEKYEFGPPITAIYETMTKKSYAWLKASVWFYAEHSPDSLDACLVINMKHHNKTFKYRETKISGKGFKPKTWNKLDVYYLTPDLRTNKEEVGIFFWNRSKTKIFIDDMTLEAFEPINDKSVF